MEIRDLVLSILLFAEQWGEEAERYVDHNDPDWGWDNLASTKEIQNTLFRLETAGEVTWRLNQHKRREWIWRRLPYQALLEKLGYDNPYVLVSMYSYLIDSDSSPDEKRIVGLDETSPWQTLGLSSTEEVAEVLRGLVPLHNSGGEPITAIQDIDGVECFVILQDPHVILVDNFSRIEDFLRKPVEAILAGGVAPHEEDEEVNLHRLAVHLYTGPLDALDRAVADQLSALETAGYITTDGFLCWKGNPDNVRPELAGK